MGHQDSGHCGHVTKKGQKPAVPTFKQRLSKVFHTVAFGELRIKRKDKQLRVTWGETLMAPVDQPQMPPTPMPSVVHPGTQDIDALLRFERTKSALASDVKLVIQAELRIVLDAHANNRKALKHLVHFERGFRNSGMEAFDRVSVAVLDKMQQQLLMLAAVHRELKDSKLMTAISDALAQRLGKDASFVGGHPSNLDDSNKLLVAAGRYTEFLMEDNTIEDAVARPTKQPSKLSRGSER